MKKLSISMIHEAFKVVQQHIIKTPVEHSAILSELLGAPVYLKLEPFRLPARSNRAAPFIGCHAFSEIEKKERSDHLLCRQPWKSRGTGGGKVGNGCHYLCTQQHRPGKI